MHFLYWIDRHAGIYRALSILVVLVVVAAAAWRISGNIDKEREMPLAEALTLYSSTLESGTINSRAMGAAILFGLENNEAKQLLKGKLPPNAPNVLSALNSLRTLYFSDAAFLVNRHGIVAAYSSQGNSPGTGVDLSYSPYVQLAMQGSANVYPAVDNIINERGIFLAAPVHAGLDNMSKTIGAVVIKIGAAKLDALLNNWNDPAMLVSPQGIVFAANRKKWQFYATAKISAEQLEKTRHSRQFGNVFDLDQPLTLPFTLNAPEIRIDGIRYIVRSHPLEWDDHDGDWKLVLLDRRDPWWIRWDVLGMAALFGLIATLALFWLSTLARNAALQQKIHHELGIAAATFDSREGVIITDADKKIIKVNHSFTEITGYSSEEAVGNTPAMLSSGRHDEGFYRQMWDAVERDKIWRGEIWNKRKNGEIYPEQLTITPIFGEGGQLANYVGIFSDITQRKMSENEIHKLAFYDPLTGLPNRRLLYERLVHAIAASKRDGRYGALMFLDMDKFKQLNDTHGHSTGDLLLVEVAQRIARCVRETDTVARFGGDEFIVMLGELDADKTVSAKEAGIVAEKILALLAEPYVLTLKHENAAPVTVQHHCSSSIGVVLFAGNSATTEEILKWADAAMYQAKEAGRNLIRFYDSN